ncbi:ATP-binding cassette domain-containing protein [Lactococcus cremoris]|uniref:ATP-binding cassette domain-containing protein n=1 Tax=Lactococcus lactis subsp. cremoris TaxID=1359 RepID=UPI0028719C1C|nr:ATP-binding cassette domain-containing protein [Lactococcus cremoris]MDR9868662.1 ATP-binding cassette domain-containing protein [Lactococcus cremoris]
MIELKNIEKAYDAHNILHNFNYQFEDNKSYALVGKSGSGKTTLLNIIGRLELPDKGDILVDGDNLKTIPERRYFKDYLGYLFQNYGLIDNESIKDNLKLAFIGKKLKSQDQEIIMSKALSKVGLENYNIDRKIFSLSGGEAQRVAIAKLIIKSPPIILADEPTGSLDRETGKEVMDILLSLVKKNTTVIIATHDSHVYNRVDSIINL